MAPTLKDVREHIEHRIRERRAMVEGGVRLGWQHGYVIAELSTVLRMLEQVESAAPAGPWVPCLSSDIREQIKGALQGVPGIAEVRVDKSDPRFYIVRSTTDADRDYEIVSRICDIETALGKVLDYDLVPAQSVGMIPDSEPI